MPKIGLNHKIAVCLVNKVNNKRTGREKINFYDCNCYEYFHFHGNFVCDILSAKTLTCDTRSISFCVSKNTPSQTQTEQTCKTNKKNDSSFFIIIAVDCCRLVCCRREMQNFTSLVTSMRWKIEICFM